MSPFIDIHPVAIGPHLEAELEVTEAKAEEGGILQLRVHLPQQLPADAELPRRFPAMVKIPPFSGHGTCIKVTGQGARDADGQRGDLYVVLRLTDAEALTSSDPPLPPFSAARVRTTPPPVVQQHRTLPANMDKNSPEALAAELEEMKRIVNEAGVQSAASATPASSDENESSGGGLGILLGLGLSAVIGGLARFDEVSSFQPWLVSSGRGLVLAVVAGFAVGIVAVILCAIMKAVDAQPLADFVDAVSGVALYMVIIGFLLAPTWAWISHGKEWRTKPLATVSPYLPEGLSLSGLFAGSQKGWSPPSLPPHHWDDGLMPEAQATQAIQIKSYQSEPTADGSSRVILTVQNGTNGRLSAMDLQLSISGVKLPVQTCWPGGCPEAGFRGWREPPPV
jgi:hypothetical protein